MQEKVNSILEANKLIGANIPLGIWKYASFEPNEAEGIKNVHKDSIDKYCGIFKTLGDRRLQTNLFQGLHRLIKEVTRSNSEAFGA